MYVGESGNGDRDKWYEYTNGDEDENMFEGIGNDIKFAMAKASYNFRNSIKQWMSEVLNILYEAAALCINTIRTFYLIVLAILGPLVFGLAVLMVFSIHLLYGLPDTSIFFYGCRWQIFLEASLARSRKIC